MDEPIIVNDTIWKKRLSLIFLSLVVIAIAYYFTTKNSAQLYKIESANSAFVIRTSGTLRPLVYRDLYSPQDGEIRIVKEIPIGGKVQRDELIISISNLEMEGSYSQKRREYSNEEYEFQQKLISLKQDNSKTELERLSTETKYEGAKSELLAYLRHPDVIPALELAIKKREIELLDKQIEQLKEISEDQRVNINQFEENWRSKKEFMNEEINILSSALEALNIKSPINGNIEYIDESLQTGKIVRKGQVLGRVSDFSSWAAYLDVPASSIDMIKAGDKVILDVNNYLVAGYIHQIDQKVENQTIKIVAKIEPENRTVLRSDLRINATITVDDNKPLSMAKIANNIPANAKRMNVVAYYKNGTKNRLDIKIREIHGENVVFESLGSQVEAIGF